MSLLVTGSIGIDSVTTPHGRVNDVLGGSAVYFSLAASLFTRVRMVGVVGEDFDDELFAPLKEHEVDLRGVEKRAGSQTFRWQGRYEDDMSAAQTVGVQLNVLAEAAPQIPAEYEDSQFVFLANTHPKIQKDFATQMSGAKLIVMDTMDLWINTERDALAEALGVVHGIVLNDGEARALTGSMNLTRAAHDILEMGPWFVIVKKGEHGSMLATREGVFLMPPYPTMKTVDPTGCGDTFAGAMMGYAAAQDKTDVPTLRAAMARGSVVASYVIESFSVDALAGITSADVEQRLDEIRKMAEIL